jgi:hypothetical protein
MAEDKDQPQGNSLEEAERNAIVMIVQFPGMVIIGKCNGDMIFKPRLIGRDPQGNIVLADMMCSPRDPMYVGGSFCFSYEPGLKDPIRQMYYQKVTGIILAGKTAGN